ncbi:hypothetical protein FD724_30335 [Nostoc sp. C057]|uniref:hypothetical protein n=1 Tax=Nostoc sp. C057 TaxID=2576903 RepID=UPI0015C3DBF6|nr:hypothetical protein [Nostoc sp. C057]QLE51925.1 hypothetical protein FD724_30335 [Nostoc sp. C057]
MTIWLIVSGIAILFDLQTEIVTSIAIASLYGLYFVVLIQCNACIPLVLPAPYVIPTIRRPTYL